jgi:uncharacterized protein YqeY
VEEVEVLKRVRAYEILGRLGLAARVSRDQLGRDLGGQDIAQHRLAGRPDLAASESAEITVLERYLPTALSDAETEALVASVIAELGASSKQDMGRVMKTLQDRSAGRADGKILSQLVAKALA